MNNSIAAETFNSPIEGAVPQPKAANKASRAPQRAHLSKQKAKSAKKAGSTKKSKNATPAVSARKGSKTDKVLALLKRPGGATAKELIKATGWQAHSLRGFLSGTVGKKMGLTIMSIKGQDGERNYTIKA
jgi:hypothetical protein